MSKTDFDRLFNQLDSLSVGFAPLFRDFHSRVTATYPPHNIVKTTDNVFILELAVAGFKKHEISVKEHQGELTITGSKDTSESEEYQYRGIGMRNFEKKFKLAEFMEIVDARLEDGMLSVTMMRNVPEEEQPKLITIK